MQGVGGGGGGWGVVVLVPWMEDSHPHVVEGPNNACKVFKDTTSNTGVPSPSADKHNILDDRANGSPCLQSLC